MWLILPLGICILSALALNITKSLLTLRNTLQTKFVMRNTAQLTAQKRLYNVFCSSGGPFVKSDKIALMTWRLQIYNKKVYAFTRQGGLKEDAIVLHYGKCKIQHFGSHLILGTISQDSSASAASM